MRGSKNTTSNSSAVGIYRTVGSKIREGREQSGLTQETLAEAVGLTRTSLTNIEKGRQKMLLHTFLEIANVLKLEPAKLLPQKSESLSGIAIKLPSDLRPEEREFITRTLTPVSK